MYDSWSSREYRPINDRFFEEDIEHSLSFVHALGWFSPIERGSHSLRKIEELTDLFSK